MGQFSVLLAEDSPVNRDVGRAMLATLGCSVDVASNGLEAIRMLEANWYDLVFMDCRMPVMDGLEAVARIREMESGKGRRVPVVALTGESTEGERNRCLAAGMDDHLGKPFSLKELSEVLKRWLGSEGEWGEKVPDAAGRAATVPGGQRAESGRPCIDQATLDNMRSIFGSEAAKMLPVLIRIYLDDSPSLVEEIEKAAEAGDFMSLRDAAHALKSTSANIGANVLAELCRQAEEMAGNLGESLEKIVSGINLEYVLVRDSLIKELEKGGM